MKNYLLNVRMLKLKSLLCLFILGVFFSVLMPKIGSAQTVITGQLFTYSDAMNENDTTGLVGTNVYVKFYYLNGQNQLMFVKQAPVNSQGYYSVTVYTSNDLYAIVVGDDVQDNFNPSFYPGWLDFESAEAISPSDAINGVIDYDWGAVGKEIVERPGGLSSTVSGIVKTSTPFVSDYVVNAYLLDANGNVVTSAPVAADGRYNLSFYGTGNYEVFTSIPGFISQSKYINVSENSKGNFNINFDLDTYKGENEINASTVADKFNLSQNYPNPFNPTTNISFTVNTTGIVKLTVYNSLGKEVTKLVNDLVEPGTYDIQFNGQNLASGIYYYTLQVGNNVITKKMNLIK